MIGIWDNKIMTCHHKFYDFFLFPHASEYYAPYTFRRIKCTSYNTAQLVAGCERTHKQTHQPTNELTKISPCCPGNFLFGLWATKSEGVGLIVRAISFQDFQPMYYVVTIPPTSQTDGRTDTRQTDDMR